MRSCRLFDHYATLWNDDGLPLAARLDAPDDPLRIPVHRAPVPRPPPSRCRMPAHVDPRRPLNRAGPLFVDRHSGSGECAPAEAGVPCEAVVFWDEVQALPNHQAKLLVT